MSAVKVDNVHKKFKVYYDKGQTFKEKLLFKNRNYYEDRWVLRGVSLEIEKGEAIGIIGENGCGKSTLLKLMTKILYPDVGTIEIQGRVSSLIELGAGFHPDMTGRENIYINASIFGLTKKEIDSRLEDIIAFSELEQFIDNPVRTYSSGMYMRLAFSVAINVDADVLLIDEILAVGDANFQAKCFDKMKEIKNNGTTIVLVSHSLGQIEQICQTTYWIENGIIRKSGKPQDVHGAYLSAMGEKRQIAREKEEEKILGKNEFCEAVSDGVEVKSAVNNNELNSINHESKANSRKIRFGSKQIEIAEVRMLNINNEIKSVFKTGEPFKIRMEYISKEKNLKGNFGIGIFTNDDVKCYGTNTYIENKTYIDVNERGYVEVCINNNNLLTGEYYLNVAVYSYDNFPFDDIQCIKYFSIVSDKSDVGLCRLEAKWEADGIFLDELDGVE